MKAVKTESRSRQSFKNMFTGISMRILNLLIGFISRTIFIDTLGSVCLGVNGLFTSIISMLSLADLGFGEAITFYLYKPIATNDKERIASLIRFYKIAYKIVGLAMLAVGLSLMPFLPKFLNLETSFEYNVYIIYILYLLNTVFSYLFFSYPQTFLTANQRQDIVNNVSSAILIISFTCEIIVLLLKRNFLYYLYIKVFFSILKNIVMFIFAIKNFPYILHIKGANINKEEFKKMFEDIYSIFVVKIASQLFTSTDNIFISYFLGTILVGINSNYTMITGALTTLIGTITNALSGSVGNYCSKKSKMEIESLYKTIDFGVFIISFISTVCLFNLFNDFITLAWGKEYLLKNLCVFLICSNYYIPISLYGLFCFRQSMGLFKAYRYNQLFAAIINIILDFLLVNKIGIVGIFLATTIANVLFAVFPFIKNLYIEGFGRTGSKACIEWVIRYAFTMLICLIVKFEFIHFNINWFTWFVKAMIIAFECIVIIIVLKSKSLELKNLKKYINKLVK